MRDLAREKRGASTPAEKNAARGTGAQRADDASHSGGQFPAAAFSGSRIPASSAESASSWTGPAEVHADRGGGYGSPVAERTKEAQSVVSPPALSSYKAAASPLADVRTLQGPYDDGVIKPAETESPQAKA